MPLQMRLPKFGFSSRKNNYLKGLENIMERKIVHVVGTGTIGEPLIGLLCDYQGQLGIDEITFHKNTASKIDKSKVVDLLKRGARLAVNDGKENDFKKLKIDSDLRAEDAIERASVVIDCAPKGIGHENKVKYYKNFSNQVKGFIAQGSENGFGKKTSHTEYRVTNRGGKGIIGIINSPRNGNISSSFPVYDGDEILISTNKGRVIRVAVKEIRTAGRNTQGVRIIKLTGEEKVVSADKIDDNLV